MDQSYKTERVVLQGNEACSKAAIFAGCKFFAGYPITPSTEIIEYMSSEMVKCGGIFIQMEDEIASACAIIGARWGGKKSMTATSGPGFTLKQEAIGYAVVTETPCVIVNVQRGGPSTGQPTLSSQQDIYQTKYGSHGDYEIIALAPSSVQEMYDFTITAFELSEKFRTPVIILTDEVVGHMREKILVNFGEKSIRAGHREYVISPQADFFTGNEVLVEGQLHDANGYRVGHIPAKSAEFIKTINNKILDNIDEIASVDAYFMEDADVAIITYGSVTRPSLDAVREARGVEIAKQPKSNFFMKLLKKDISELKGEFKKNNSSGTLKIGLIKINTVWPFPEKKLKKLAENCHTVFVPEMNIGKYSREIERCLKNTKVVSVPKLGGEIHTPSELLNIIVEEVTNRE